MSLENQVGVRYHKLLVLEDFTVRTHCKLVRKVRCTCDCGNTKVILLSAVRGGHTKSCGCDIGRKFVYEDPTEPAFINLYSKYRERSKKNGKSFELSKDEFRILTKSNCHYCGVEPLQQAKNVCRGSVLLYNGVDRMDSSLGYIISNVVPCCFTCNRAKMAMPLAEFTIWVQRIYKNQEAESIRKSLESIETLTQVVEALAAHFGVRIV